VRGDDRRARWLLRLYPAWWRDRYSDEFTELLESLAPRRRPIPLAVDVLRGALDARLRGSSSMIAPRSVARQGIGDGVVIAALVSIPVIAMTTAGFAGSAGLLALSDGWRTAIRQLAMAVPLLAMVVAGMRAPRRCGGRFAGVRAGAVAGFTLGILITLLYVAIDNTLVTVAEHPDWFSVTSQPIAAWRTGWELRAGLLVERSFLPDPVIGQSLRAVVNIRELFTAILTIPAYALAGALLAVPGAALARPAPAQ
jgi:hypothetical protein